MSRIIKLTESQLRDVVQKVINEQSSGVSVDQIYKEFVAGGTGAKATSHTVMASAINKIPDYKTLLALNNMIKQKTPGGLTSLVQCLQTWLKVGEENIFKNIQAKLKTLGVNLVINNPSGIFKPADIRIAKGGVKKPDPKKTEPNIPTYKVCQGFPIKYGCKQTEVGRLQKCMGMEVDYSFGPDTLGAFLNLNPDPKAKAAAQKQILEVGLSEGAYKLVIAKCKYKPKQKQKQKQPKPVVDTRTPMKDLAPLKAKQLQQIPTSFSSGEAEKAMRANLLKQLAASAPPQISQERKDFIIGNIKNRGFDQVYKGEKLTPEEKQWLDYYMSLNYGSQVDKTKPKGDDNEKIRYDNQ